MTPSQPCTVSLKFLKCNVFVYLACRIEQEFKATLIEIVIWSFFSYYIREILNINRTLYVIDIMIRINDVDSYVVVQINETFPVSENLKVVLRFKPIYLWSGLFRNYMITALWTIIYCNDFQAKTIFLPFLHRYVQCLAASKLIHTWHV